MELNIWPCKKKKEDDRTERWWEKQETEAGQRELTDENR